MQPQCRCKMQPDVRKRRLDFYASLGIYNHAPNNYYTVQHFKESIKAEMLTLNQTQGAQSGIFMAQEVIKL